MAGGPGDSDFYRPLPALAAGKRARAFVDDCPRGYQTKAGIVTLLGHLDRYAYEIDVISKMYSQVITVRDLDVPDSDRQPFTPEERKKLWDRRADPRVQVVLIYIFTGWRLMELLNMRPEDIDLESGPASGLL